MENQKLPEVKTEVTFEILNTETLGQLKDMQPGFSPSLKYKTADEWAKHKGQELRAYYMGMKEIPNEDGELIACGVFITETECFLSGQLTLVEAVKMLPLKTPVGITYLGKKNNKSSNGSTMLFDVITLK